MITKIPPAKDSGFGRNHRKTPKSYNMTVSEGSRRICTEEKGTEESTLAQNRSNLQGNTTRGEYNSPGGNNGMVSDASSAGTTVDPGGEKSSYISAKHQPFTQCNFQPRKMTHTYLPR